MIRPKAVIPLGLVAGFIFHATVFASFPDVPASHPNYDAVIYAQAQGFVSGYPDGTYKPDKTINRAEFTKIIISVPLLNQTEFPRCTLNTKFPLFSDVHLKDWFYPFVCLGVESETIKGYPDGTFRPANAINFVEAAKIIVNHERLAEGPLLPSTSNPWYKEYVDDLAHAHAIPTSIHSFDQKITRGEMAEIIWRLKAGMTTKDSQTYESLARGEQNSTLVIRASSKSFVNEVG